MERRTRISKTDLDALRDLRDELVSDGHDDGYLVSLAVNFIEETNARDRALSDIRDALVTLGLLDTGGGEEEDVDGDR